MLSMPQPEKRKGVSAKLAVAHLYAKRAGEGGGDIARNVSASAEKRTNAQHPGKPSVQHAGKHLTNDHLHTGIARKNASQANVGKANANHAGKYSTSAGCHNSIVRQSVTGLVGNQFALNAATDFPQWTQGDPAKKYVWIASQSR